MNDRVMRRPIVIALIAGAALGLMIGIGGYTFVYAKGYSYLTNNPSACANCHVMSQQYAAWQRGPHRSAAVCNDCHTPHALVGKYATKASNGFRHSFYFTSGRYPDYPPLTASSRAVIEEACRRCHGDIVQEIDSRSAHANALDCIRCHADAGHM